MVEVKENQIQKMLDRNNQQQVVTSLRILIK